MEVNWDMGKQTVIQVNSISKHYGANKAVDGISFYVQEGEIFGLIGADGAGKTTLIEMLLGLGVPDSGQISVLGQNVCLDAESLKEDVGVHLGSTALVDRMSVREALELFQVFYKHKTDINNIIEQFGLGPYEDKLIKRLSGGWRQRVALAIALVNDPKIIFLDEPTTGLDMQAKKDYWAIIKQLKQQGKTIVVASHDMEEVQFNCDRVCVLRNGECMVCDKPETLISELPGGGMTMEGVYMHYAVNAVVNYAHRD
jgi:ABC-2 type transport system ATP-binding protein